MKKNILKLVFASAFALLAGYSVYDSQQNIEMSDLAMANVEALARGEGSGIPYKGAYANWEKGGGCKCFRNR